ncbi:MAG TPA: hypothetical protein VMH02_09420 [Verrucomicrobiae bacterium]|nr:hypothetical protein [Verrucomicrobiae bacterium]
MTQLTERLTIPKYEKPQEYLNRTICQISDYQQPDRVRLRVPLSGIGEGPALQKEVEVVYRSKPGAPDHAWNVRWKADGRFYPDFDGTLAVERDDRTGDDALVLAGEYEPPLGAAGKAFDAVLGARIASATAREFLRAIAQQMEQERRHS